MRQPLTLLGVLVATLLLAACAGPRSAYAPWPPRPGDAETGLASWYGGKFHGRKTSSGEIYDMHQITAAHKTLPLGTWVEVLHLETGRTIQVRVNDRGPFVAGRISDLSYGAARMLGMVEEGVAPVRVRTIAATAAPVARPGTASSGRFTMQLGSFTSRENATAFAGTLRQRWGGVHVVTARLDGESVFRVRMGTYPNRAEAWKAAEGVAGAGYDVVIMQVE